MCCTGMPAHGTYTHHKSVDYRLKALLLEQPLHLLQHHRSGLCPLTAAAAAADFGDAAGSEATSAAGSVAAVASAVGTVLAAAAAGSAMVAVASLLACALAGAPTSAMVAVASLLACALAGAPTSAAEADMGSTAAAAAVRSCCCALLQQRTLVFNFTGLRLMCFLRSEQSLQNSTCCICAGSKNIEGTCTSNDYAV
jgi:hypothetical protein